MKKCILYNNIAIIIFRFHNNYFTYILFIAAQKASENIVLNHTETKDIEANIDDMERNILPKLLYDYLKETSLDSSIKDKEANIVRWKINIKEAELIVNKVLFIINSVILISYNLIIL